MKKVKIPLEQFVHAYTTTEGKKVDITVFHQCPICLNMLSFMRDPDDKSLIIVDDCDHKDQRSESDYIQDRDY